jgi:NADH-quinone oxidoreductase subunit M
MSTFPILTVLTFVPLLGGLATICVPKFKAKLACDVALAFSLAVLALTLLLCGQMNRASGGMQFEERHPWAPSLGVDYHVAVDGLGLVMLILSAILVPMAIAASWKVTERAPLYFALILFIETGLVGTFTALNFFHWFLFWELSLIPAFFLILLWGGPGRSAAATQFFVYTMVGSITLLLSFAAIYLSVGSFDFLDLATLARSGQLLPALADKLAWHSLSQGKIGLILFFGAFLGFAVKVPLMPFHTWLPSTYAEAPTGASMLLTGAMSKMGVYGFLRILFPIFPQQMQWMRTPLLWLAVATIVLPAFTAFAQRDLKRIIAYSSISHLGYCLLGLFAVAEGISSNSARLTEQTAALDGVIWQIFSHGLTAAVLFWFVAIFEERAGGLRGLNDFGGLRKVAPIWAGLMGIAIFSSLGLPGLSGFIGEFLILRGVFSLAGWAASISVLGLLLTAVFLLTILERVFSGPLNEKWSTMPDLSMAEQMVFVPPIALMFLLGIYPQLLLSLVNSTVLQMVK